MSDLYEVENLPPKPALPGSVVIRPEIESLVDALAADLLIHAHNCVRTFGDFHLALSGGSTPIPFYIRLMIDPALREFPWPRTHLWIVDERRVPFDDDRSNFRAINEILGDHSGIPHEQVHPIFAMADDPAGDYQRLLQETLGWRERGQDRLDYALLGMGADGHTASLFPGSPALRDELGYPDSPSRVAADLKAPAPLVRINSGENVTPPDRVTMTFRLLNASRFLALMVTGEVKRDTLRRVIHAAAAPGPIPRDQIDQLPVLGLRPLAGELRWYLDHAACPTAHAPTPATAPDPGNTSNA